MIAFLMATLAIFLTAATAGCGSAAAPAPPAARAATVVVTQSVTPPPVVQTVTETVRESVTEAPPATTAPTVKTPSSVPKKPISAITVPDGVGMNYQQAQDAWRAAGLHVSPAEDATGAHRIPVLDANWVVLAQDLEPGSKVAADSFITATVKKYSDG